MTYIWDFSIVSNNVGLLAAGLVNTLSVTAISLVIGTGAGLGLALMRTSNIRALSWPALAFVEIFRAVPALVQLYWFYFAMPRIFDIRLTSFQATVIALSLVSCAFISEVFRGGILSVHAGQWEAAKGLGMSGARTMQVIVLPQAIRRMLPVFLERAIELLKTSTIASAISFADLLFVAEDISYRTYRTLEIFTVVAMMFFIMIFICSQLTSLVEHRMARSGEIRVR
jgi:polar amino acid transport system permease protein